MAKTYLWVVIAVLFGASLGGSYLYGKQAGRVTQLERSIKLEKARKNVDNDVAHRDDYQLCISVGGVPDDCEQLRRVDPAPENQ